VQVLISLLQASSVFGRSSQPYTALLHKHRVSQTSTEQPYLWGLIQHLGLQGLLETGALNTRPVVGLAARWGWVGMALLPSILAAVVVVGDVRVQCLHSVLVRDN
jgi:hypothetical protein